jgi:hypothetical protein
MRELIKRIILLASLTLIGCATYSNKHFALMDAPPKENISSITDSIKNTVEPILYRHGLQDRLTSTIPKGVMLYYSTGGNSAIRVGFRVQENKVVFDAFQYHPGAGDTDAYTNLVTEVLSALRNIKGVEIIETDGPSI